MRTFSHSVQSFGHRRPVEAYLASEEAGRRLKRFGPNTVPDTTLNPFRMVLEKFWAPVPWMLEAAIVLQTSLGVYVEAAIIAGLLVFNGALAFFQEGHSRDDQSARADGQRGTSLYQPRQAARRRWKSVA